LAKSLHSEIVVTELSRMKAWPKSFEASMPTDNNIALYLLPCQMRCLAYPLRSICINSNLLHHLESSSNSDFYP
jgi:hypothetical protein